MESSDRLHSRVSRLRQLLYVHSIPAPHSYGSPGLRDGPRPGPPNAGTSARTSTMEETQVCLRQQHVGRLSPASPVRLRVRDVLSNARRPRAKEATYSKYLTKRPGRAVAWWDKYKQHFPQGWPANVWIGTSVESQKYAPRLTVLSRLPAPVRFVSVEPLLEPVDLSTWLDCGTLQWVIVGGESGQHARPMDLDWVRSLRDQSTRAGVAFFLKQLGGARNKRGGDHAVIDDQRWLQMPVTR